MGMGVDSECKQNFKNSLLKMAVKGGTREIESREYFKNYFLFFSYS